MKVRAVRFGSIADNNKLLASPIKMIDWREKAASSNLGLCFFPVNGDEHGYDPLRYFAEDIKEFGINLSRDLHHSCEEMIVADVEVDHWAWGSYSWAELNEVGVYTWDHVKLISRVPIYKALTWQEVNSL